MPQVQYPSVLFTSGAAAVSPMLGDAVESMASPGQIVGQSGARQSAEQKPLPFSVLPSSQTSGPTTMPSPQIAGVKLACSVKGPTAGIVLPRTTTSTGPLGAAAKSTSSTSGESKVFRQASSVPSGSAQSETTSRSRSAADVRLSDSRPGPGTSNEKVFEGTTM